MRRGSIILVVAIIFISLAAAEMPLAFYTALGNIRNVNVVCVKNYDAGASITEAYTNFEHLDKDTEIVSQSYNYTEESKEKDCAFLEARISTEVAGNAHIAWQSRDSKPDRMGRHALIGLSVEDLTGVFSIEKFIQLWSNSTANNTSVSWLPCD